MWCWVFDSLHTILFPIKRFAVSSLLDYPAVSDAFRQSNITMLSSSAVECLFSADAAWMMRQ